MEIINYSSALDATEGLTADFNACYQALKNKILTSIGEQGPDATTFTARYFELTDKQIMMVKMLDKEFLANLPYDVAQALDNLYSTTQLPITEAPETLERPSISESTKTTPASTGGMGGSK
jgi:hypothetical protein